jgi:uncharacterized iron-regulated protein
MNSKRSVTILFVTFTMLFATACSSQLERGHRQLPAMAHAGGEAPKQSGESEAVQVVDMTAQLDLDHLIPRLTGKRVVYVGETHDAYGHHLNQLAVIKALHLRNPDLAIGMEFFQQPFQQVLDDYIAGRTGEREMLRGSEWYKRWRFDYRLYRPILQYAREQGIPVIALNVAKELTDRVSEVGFEGLEPSERARIAQEFDDSDPDYRARIRSVYEHHPGATKDGFERFLQVQLAWDEGMAEQAVRYLTQHPKKQLVVLAGSGHLMYGTGIPERVGRRLSVESAILLPADTLKVEPGIADYLVYPRKAELPKAGLMGVLLEDHEKGVRITGVVPKSAAAGADLKKGDIIQRLDGAAVTDFVDVKLGLLGKVPGEQISIKLLRPRMVLGDEELEKQFPLGN